MKLPALVAMMVLAHTAFGGGRIVLMLLAIAQGGTPFEVGLLVGALAAVPMLLSVHAGRWIDRSGVGRPTLLSLALIEAALLLLALRPGLAMLGAAAVLLGCGFMFMHLVVNHAVGHASAPERRTGAFSMLALGISISTVAGPVSAGFLIDLAGHAGAFLALALLPWLALFLLGAFGAPTTAPTTMPTTAASTAPPARPRMADLLRHAPLRAVFIVSSLLSMGWDLFTFMAPMHGDRIGLSASTIGLVMGAFGAGTFVVRLLIPSLARLYSGWQVLAAALALTALVYVLFPLSETAPTLLALAFVLGLGLGCAMPMIMSAIHDCAPPGRSGEAIGVRSMLINASQAVLPAVFGALGSATGTGVVFWAVGGLLAGGCVYAARHHRHPH